MFQYLRDQKSRKHARGVVEGHLCCTSWYTMTTCVRQLDPRCKAQPQDALFQRTYCGMCKNWNRGKRKATVDAHDPGEPKTSSCAGLPAVQTYPASFPSAAPCVSAVPLHLPTSQPPPPPQAYTAPFPSAVPCVSAVPLHLPTGQPRAPRAMDPPPAPSSTARSSTMDDGGMDDGARTVPAMVDAHTQTDVSGEVFSVELRDVLMARHKKALEEARAERDARVEARAERDAAKTELEELESKWLSKFKALSDKLTALSAKLAAASSAKPAAASSAKPAAASTKRAAPAPSQPDSQAGSSKARRHSTAPAATVPPPSKCSYCEASECSFSGPLHACSYTGRGGCRRLWSDRCIGIYAGDDSQKRCVIHATCETHERTNCFECTYKCLRTS